MSGLTTVLILLAALAAVFWQSAFELPRHLLRAQLDLLPPLMVFASLSTNFPTLCLLAVLGGLWYDSLSANPLGISILPLLLIGAALYAKRELILKNQAFAQMVLGAAASVLSPGLVLMMLLTFGYTPLVGWGTVWQFIVLGAGGALVTPLIFILFEWLERTLVHTRIVETSFRTDREIRRGR